MGFHSLDFLRCGVTAAFLLSAKMRVIETVDGFCCREWCYLRRRDWERKKPGRGVQEPQGRSHYVDTGRN